MGNVPEFNLINTSRVAAEILEWVKESASSWLEEGGHCAVRLLGDAIADRRPHRVKRDEIVLPPKT
jgi:hypothetical protein